MFVLAHISDPHLPTPPGIQWASLANKRLFGYLSWRLRRSMIHRPEVLAAVLADIGRIGADHLVITGDLVNIALPAEFAAAAAWLRTVGPPDAVTVVPGNHDAYVAVPPALSWDRWRPYMSGEAGGAEAFPFVRRRGSVALIGLSTAEPSAPGMAYGRLGSWQLHRLSEVLAALATEGFFRVVLLHHPPLSFLEPRRKRLIDAVALHRVIARHGAELILHGHDHHLSVELLSGPDGPVAVFGAPSASAARGDNTRLSQYLLYRIARTKEGWTVAVTQRLIDARAATVRETLLWQSTLPHHRRLGDGDSPAASVPVGGRD